MHARSLLLIVAVMLALAGCGSPDQRAAEYLARAQTYYDAGDYTKARLEAQNAVQVAPRNARARFLLADIAEKRQEYQQMVGHLQVAVTVDPSNVEGRLKLGSMYFLGQAWTEAAEQADALLKLAPKDARVRVLKARMLFQKGDRARGLVQVDTALKLDPDNVDAIALKANAYGLGQFDKALATLDVAIGRLPKDKTRQLREQRIVLLAQANRNAEVETGLRELARDYPEEQGYPFQLAQFYSGQGRMDEAIKLLKKITELDPKNVDNQLAYVQFLVNQGSEDKAEEALKAFIGMNPDALQLPLALAQRYEAGKRVPEARKLYVELGKRSPQSPEGLVARFRVAAIDFAAGRMDAARAGIASVLKQTPDDANALLLRAALRFREEKYDDAISDVRIVLRKQPNNDKALLLLATSYERKNDLALAKDSYRRLLEVAPDSPTGLKQLAGLYAADQEYADAEVLLRRCLATAPDDLVASSQLVEVLLAGGAVAGGAVAGDAVAGGSVARAEEEARRMVALKNQDGVGDYSLGRVLARKKDWSGAAEAYRKSLAARPGERLALEGLVNSLIAAGRVDEAIRVLDGQVGNGSNGGNRRYAKYTLGGLYGARGDPARAAAYLEDVVQEEPDSLDAWSALAGVYRSREDRIRVYERAVKAAPRSTELPVLLATELEQGGRYEDAIAVYEALLKTSPKFEPGINNLASLLLDRRTDKASHARALKLAQGMASTGENPAFLDTLGWAYYRAGKYSDAVSLLERVVARAGQYPVFRYHLGMAYLRAGNKVGARQELRQTVDPAGGDFPGMAEARATLAALEKQGKLADVKP